MQHPRKRQKGQAAVEVALMAPWIFFLFVGVFDLGFYCYAAICTQNAARAVAIAYSSGGISTPCQAALGELTTLPNINSGSCTLRASGSTTFTPPLTVWVNQQHPAACPDAGQGSAASASSTAYFCLQSVVQYQTMKLLPIPGLLTGQMTLTRTAWMRIIQ